MLELNTQSATPSTQLTQVRTSIIIVNYNGGEQVLDCLRSLQADQRSDYEIIVVDNGSTDGSPERIESEFLDVQVICALANLGFGGGNNLGAHYAKGEYLAFLNQDTRVEPGWLNALIAALQDDPSVGMVTSKILLMDDPSRINTCGNDIHISGLTLCRGMGHPATEFESLEEVDAVSGAAFAMRRALFEELGGFDEDFFLYLEDTDLSLRARLAGWHIFYVHGSLVYHDYRLTFGSHKTYYHERNRYRMLLKNLRWRTLLVLLPALLLAEVVTWGFSLARDRKNLGNKLRAYAWMIRNWDDLKQTHNQTQALRQVPDRVLFASAQYRLGFEQTGSGWIPKLSHLIFDPLFFSLRLFAHALL
jgi:GT2 family glycosyltransferase